jgi:putative MATE family efflux protein
MISQQVTSESPRKTLYKMTRPMLIGVLSLMSFQLVDSAFIGQLGVAPLAAQGFTLPMHMLIIGLQVGLGIATTSVISRTLGAGKEDYARRLGGLVVLFGAIMIMLLCALLWAVQEPALTALGAPPELLPLIRIYWGPWLASGWLGSMLYFGYSLSRSHGNTVLPGTMMVITSLLNMLLDPVFIFVLDLGLPGAAWATIVSFTIGCLVVYPRLFANRWITFALSSGASPLSVPAALKQLGAIMGPAMLSQLMPPLSSMLATKLVASFGTAAVGAWALGIRLEFFSLVVVLALTMSLPPLVGRLLGAGKITEIQNYISIAVKFLIVWQLGIALLLLLLTDTLSHLLTTEAAISEILSVFLHRIPISSGALGICILMVSVCNALGMPMRALLISCLRLFVCFLPMLWIGAQLAGINGLLTGAMIGNFAAGWLGWSLYRSGMQRILLLQQHQ